jgi:hypothetical protein
MEPRLNPLDTSSSVPLPAGTDKSAAVPTGPQIRQGDADTIHAAPKKLDRARIDLMEGKLGSKAATQMKKDKPNILKDILVGKKGRQQNAQELAAKTGTYGAGTGRATAQFDDGVHKKQTQRNLAISMHWRVCP